MSFALLTLIWHGQVMVIGAVMVSNVFTGLDTHSWTGWVWISVLIGPVLIWVYTVGPILWQVNQHLDLCCLCMSRRSTLSFPRPPSSRKSEPYTVASEMNVDAFCSGLL
jgi:hypothetical protein